MIHHKHSIKFLIFTFLLTANVSLFSQRINYDTLVYTLENPSPDFPNYLVSLAWENNPENRAFGHNVDIASADIKIAKRDWAQDVSLTFNLNENNLRPQSVLTEQQKIVLDSAGIDNQLFNFGTFSPFPRYNLGVQFNLGRLITQPKKVEIAKSRLELAKLDSDQKKMIIRAEVMRRYQTYLHAFEVYKVRVKTEQDAEEIFTLMRSRFREGSVKFEEFSRASSDLQQAKEGVLEAKGEIELAEIDIEEMIGISLEDARVFHDQAFSNQ